ncbi:transcriptional repressor LexA [Clostridium beijerinckii]|uniref:transcriptional repressor LexA n=1 Tax=Clostridium beijerinckii TaxID=1520 RepID=UPI00136181AD|nr:transcriptional repressor LexA [Clostridium beijerinckii]MZK53513.1 transcriptional repressor LexA [Clostridium beijerinckii]MZK60461.1 transcriptional repressor LexA [Clostridium beijerinckii]MZK70278.1 transcriptional repressor LexA [Clostridium beijerinckii]MZK76085.1 transcriptional repressor LexA [Clostridium beijerinckii]MZK85189.1 transcriptional repressor LexA [Clostridium beijerinckii]
MMEINKQTEIYEFLKSYTENKGYPPSVREICEAVSLASTSTVHGYLQRLEKKGLIKRDPSKPRALEIAELSMPKREMLDIPIIGNIINKVSILSKENIEDTFSLPLDYIKHDRELFMIRVCDESMINTGIRTNDLAIIELSEAAINGDIILALVNNSTTIKRFFKEKNHIRLEPENDDMNSIIIDDCKILGKLVGIFRSFE